MKIKYTMSRQDEIEVAEWVAGIGPVTKAVQTATVKYGITFGAALITRQMSNSYSKN